MNRARTILGFSGVMLAASFFLWLLLGWFGWVPSMVDVFGVAGMRTPAAITVGSLLIAAVAFHES